ncbi:hypothetical protein GCM10018793_00280 [Streptomyces sulfonofaciens]|uniref:Uncharacterized protein n=1 Tax=Streptomyces sulfonofaciens TaxID=68272 RepID=A0A919FNR0_9ACTN|nr:hypothetical protein GCM10018793_00280 [Streptomyces sulfonofaciens]
MKPRQPAMAEPMSGRRRSVLVGPQDESGPFRQPLGPLPPLPPHAGPGRGDAARVGRSRVRAACADPSRVRAARVARPAAVTGARPGRTGPATPSRVDRGAHGNARETPAGRETRHSRQHLNSACGVHYSAAQAAPGAGSVAEGREETR